MGMGGQCQVLAALPPRKNRHPLYRKLGGPQGHSGRVRKISPPPVLDPRIVQPVASRYTEWAIPAHHDEVGIKLNWFLTSALVGDEWSTSRLGLFILTKWVLFRHWRGGWEDFGAWPHALDKRQISYSCQEPNHNSSPLRPVAWSLPNTLEY